MLAGLQIIIIVQDDDHDGQDDDHDDQDDDHDGQPCSAAVQALAGLIVED